MYPLGLTFTRPAEVFVVKCEHNNTRSWQFFLQEEFRLDAITHNLGLKC